MSNHDVSPDDDNFAGRVLIVMGVSGSGKTSVGEMLARHLAWTFADADDWHSELNRSKMSQGMPLCDGDRIPWLYALQHAIDHWLASGASVVLACSALKQSYREILRCHHPHVQLVYLRGSFEFIQHRLRHRHGHFMSIDLLQTQFDALEEPQNAITVDIDQPLNEVVRCILKKVASHLPTSSPRAEEG